MYSELNLTRIARFSLLILLGTISLSKCVTVNFRNSTLFNSLADRIALASHQQKLQLEAQAQAALTTTLAPAPVVPAIPSGTVTVTEESNKENNNPSASSRWCNVTVFKKSRVTWLNAYRTCKRFGNGTELASIKTQEDYDTFVQNVKEAGSPASVIYWTSGTDVLDEGEFVWMTDGTEVTRTWWAPGQPDNHWDLEHCIAFKRYTNETNYKMTDENCLLAGAFICTQPCKFWV